MTNRDLVVDDGDLVELQQETAGEIDCVICMSGINVLRSREHMITPCNHIFHGACLEQWMNVKMECPTCRAPLPAP